MNTYMLILLIATGATTILLRAFPFIAFGSAKHPPVLIREMGMLISPAAIAMLIVYCFCKSFDGYTLSEKWFGTAEWTAALVVILIHLKWKNPLVSIIAGTAVYMLIVQYLIC